MATRRRGTRRDVGDVNGWNFADIWEAAASEIPDATFAMQEVDDSRPRHDAIDQTVRGDR